MTLPLSPERARWLLDNGNDGYMPLSQRSHTYRELMTDDEAHACHQYWISIAPGSSSFNDVIRTCANA